jgi:hypothetical protein
MIPHQNLGNKRNEDDSPDPRWMVIATSQGKMNLHVRSHYGCGRACKELDVLPTIDLDPEYVKSRTHASRTISHAHALAVAPARVHRVAQLALGTFSRRSTTTTSGSPAI